ncbi:MAG: glycosyltransferase [Acidobacteria bacterium]|nr:glycosyltransferase [Acidobacteriota bacterium]
MGVDQRRHFGVLPFTGTGHLSAMVALGLELQGRGHRVTFFEKPKIERRIREAGLGFHAVGTRESPFKGKGPDIIAGGVISELRTLQFNIRRIRQDLERYFEETEPALRRSGVDALIVNEIAITGPTLAELLKLPYFIISTSVPHNFGWNAYSAFSGYRYRRSFFSVFAAACLDVSAVRLHGPIRSAVNRYRVQGGLAPVSGINPAYPPVAQLTQLPKCLDLPRKNLPADFYYTGAFQHDGARPTIDFPWERLDGRPIIYASLGTTRNAQAHVLRMIAEGCKDIDAQLVISLGGRFDPTLCDAWPGNPLIVKFAPQLEVLKRASMVITHSGPNTVFETLLKGKPMVAIPIAHDQPAIAARIARLGVAQVLPIMKLSVEKIRTAVLQILMDPSYRQAAMKMELKLRALHGVERAAEVIEDGLRLRRAESKASPSQLSEHEVLLKTLDFSGRT